MIVISFGHCSFDQLKILNHSLTARGTDLPFSHKSTVSTMNEQNIICNKTLICRQLFAGQVMGFRPVKKERKNTSNDNLQLLRFHYKYGSFNFFSLIAVSEISRYFCVHVALISSNRQRCNSTVCSASCWRFPC